MFFILSFVFLGAVARLSLAAPQLGGQKEGHEEGEAPYTVLQTFDVRFKEMNFFKHDIPRAMKRGYTQQRTGFAPQGAL